MIAVAAARKSALTTMVDLKINGDNLDLEFLGWSKLWALRSRMTIPIASIKTVRSDGEVPKGFYFRAFGTGFPGMISAGMFTDFKRWAFFDLRADRTNVVILELAEWKYDVVAIEVRDGRATTAMINHAIALA
jgi:hypothetical protein